MIFLSPDSKKYLSAANISFNCEALEEERCPQNYRRFDQETSVRA